MATKQTTRSPRQHSGRAGRRPTTASRGARQSRSRAQASAEPNDAQVEELLLQALETELGGVQVYETAISCAVNEDLKEEWQEYLEQTRHHVEVVTQLCNERGVDTEQQSPGRRVVRALGQSLVEAMETAKESGDAAAAQLVAAECVVLAETKDHANWELLAEVAKGYSGDEAKPFQDAVDEVEDEEDEHLYHTKGWARELWIESLGMPAVLPPPEEKRDVRSMVGAAMAKKARKAMAKKSK